MTRKRKTRQIGLSDDSHWAVREKSRIFDQSQEKNGWGAKSRRKSGKTIELEERTGIGRKKKRKPCDLCCKKRAPPKGRGGGQKKVISLSTKKTQERRAQGIPSRNQLILHAVKSREKKDGNDRKKGRSGTRGGQGGSRLVSHSMRPFRAKVEPKTLSLKERKERPGVKSHGGQRSLKPV